jgi:hypothetical protein
LKKDVNHMAIQDQNDKWLILIKVKRRMINNWRTKEFPVL